MHPGCKKVHPIAEVSGFIGGYFNDNGVNIVHDNFFFPMAEETKALLRIADEYVPDISLHLHGGGNCKQQFFQFNYMPGRVKKKISALSALVAEASEKAGRGDQYYPRVVEGYEEKEPEPSFNIQSAWTALCGEPAIVYESNQGKRGDYIPGKRMRSLFLPLAFIICFIICWACSNWRISALTS